MIATGNCGHGDRGTVHEPRSARVREGAPRALSLNVYAQADRRAPLRAPKPTAARHQPLTAEDVDWMVRNGYARLVGAA